MIAGVGGASLGTEILKSLRLAGGYEVFGCDVSPTAYGIHDNSFSETYVVSRDNYVDNVLQVCLEANVAFIIPGGEEPLALISNRFEIFEQNGIRFLANSPEVTRAFSDKHTSFEVLASFGVPIPKTRIADSEVDIKEVGLPCIIKPATGTGGSAGVFFATSLDEATIYADFIRRTNRVPIVQEYISPDEGEFTIGVLTSPEGKLFGSIALRRTLDAKLSVAYRGRGGLISSGYSQGYIAEFDGLCRQAEKIALAAQSRGPFNIQGRVRDGVLIPFEINPRFSASSYLRAMAGFNEVDIFVKYLITGESPDFFCIKEGWYLRTLSENYISKGSAL